MAKFVTIGERLSTTAPAVNKAFTERDAEPILKRAKQQLDAGATYLDVNIGPAENDGPELMKWAVELLQSNFDNVPLALDTSNVAAIEAGISVYNRSKGKPIVNSADAAGRIGYVDVAAANDAIVIALCNGEGIAKDNDERMMYVVGATQGRAFEDIRKIVPNHFLLVPGVGAQGGSLEEVCKYGMNSTCGLIVNSSRGIIYVDKTEKFAEAARLAAQEVQVQMAEQLKAIL